uniref:Amino acid transporter n=1 Tax=Fundulus heteroclitus TaxID=8078 RepID=A0A3Q2Q279_FUNHE
MGNYQKGFRRCGQILSNICGNLRVFICVVAVGLGVIIGLILKTFDDLLEVEKLYITFPVHMLMGMVKVVTTPIVASGVIIAICTFRSPPSKKIGFQAAVYFVSTTLISVTIGLILGVFFEPGITEGVSEIEPEDEKVFLSFETIKTLTRNLFPENLIQSCVKYYVRVKREVPVIDAVSGLPTNMTYMKEEGHYVQGVNILSIITFAILCGLAFNEMKESSSLLVQMVCINNELAVVLLNIIGSFLPLGLLIMAVVFVDDHYDSHLVLNLVKFIAMVATGLFVHGVIVLPLLYLVCAKSNPFTVIYGAFPALWTAFRSSSSNAAKPVTLHCCKNENKIDHRITNFMLPIATELNLNGTALYQALAAVFIAQLNNIDLDFNLLFTIGATAAVSSFIAKGIPTSGALMSFLILYAVGLPMTNAWILVAVEWKLDHFTTLVNVLGDCIGVALVNKLYQDELRTEDADQDSPRTEDDEATDVSV